MSKLFIASLETETNKTRTDNGAEAVKSTNSDVVNLFSTIGSMRNRWDNSIDEKKLINMFSRAYSENKELAVKTVFYARDCRGGMGEKLVFKTLAKEFIDNGKANLITLNLDRIVEYGSFKDLIDIFCTVNNTVAKQMIATYLNKVISEDLEKEHPSLLAKWLPSIKTTQKNTRVKVKELLKYGVGFGNYAKVRKELRKKLVITETLITEGRFSEIDYSKVASRCMLIYRNTFFRKDEKRFKEYLESLKKGESKINSSVLFPSDIVGKYNCKATAFNEYEYDEVLEQQWKYLPNYMTKPTNAICVVDTSGSMEGTPMDVAMALGLYISERNPSEVFRNKCLEFSRKVNYLDFSKYSTLREKLMAYCREASNTDLQKVFDLILNTAIKNKLSQEDLPKTLIILSDMQFDRGNFTNRVDGTFMENIRHKYRQNGYTLPQIVYWNLDADTNNFPETNKEGIVLVSGYSPSIMKAILNLEEFNPINLVKEAVLTDRYNSVFFG